MKIIDTIKMPGYTQWVENFVSTVLKNANIHADTVIITEMYNKRIYLMVDDHAYMIHTEKFIPNKKDHNGIPCGENVEYALYIGHEDCEEPEDTITLKNVCTGKCNIEWVNDEKIFMAEKEQYIALHGKCEKPAEPEDGEYVMLHIKDLNGGGFDLKMDIRPLSPEELLYIFCYFAIGADKDAPMTPKLRRYLKGVHQSCADGLIDLCFEDGIYDHDYARSLICFCAIENLVCKDYVVEELQIIDRLYEEYKGGGESAVSNLKENLFAFFMTAEPYTITVS